MVAKSTSVNEALWAVFWLAVVLGTLVAGWFILYGTWWLCYG